MNKIDRSIDGNTLMLFPPCFYCKHLTGVGTQESLEGWTCKAFPAEIPFPILYRTLRHVDPKKDGWPGSQVPGFFYECEPSHGTVMTWEGDCVPAPKAGTEPKAGKEPHSVAGTGTDGAG